MKRARPSGAWTGHPRLTPQEIRHQFLPLVRQHALRMELHALHREILMSQAHDDAGSVFVRSPCADFQVAWQILLGDDQRVISSRSHRRRQAAEDGLAIVLNLAGFAVHQVLRAHHLAAEGCADRLVSEADSEHGHFAREVADQFDADAGFLRSAGSGRNHDARGVHRLDLSDRHFVVAANLYPGAQFAQVLDEVVSERIVVIEDEDHGKRPRFIVAPRARFQSFRVSRFQRFVRVQVTQVFAVFNETLKLCNLLLDSLAANCHAYRRFGAIFQTLKACNLALKEVRWPNRSRTVIMISEPPEGSRFVCQEPSVTAKTSRSTRRRRATSARAESVSMSIPPSRPAPPSISP